MFDYWLWDSALPKWFCEEQIKNTDWSKKQIGKVAKATTRKAKTPAKKK